MIKKIIFAIYLSLKNFSRSYLSLNYYTNEGQYCSQFSAPNSKALDLGCGKTPRNSFNAAELFGLDLDYGIDQDNKIYPCDLGMEPIPFPDAYFDFVTAHDLIEHIPRIIFKNGVRHTPFIFLMNEILRVLKNDGIFLSNTPAYPNLAAFSDPTHINIISVHSFKLYFCSPFNWATRYGYKGGTEDAFSFVLIEQGWHKNNLISLLKKQPTELVSKK